MSNTQKGQDGPSRPRVVIVERRQVAASSTHSAPTGPASDAGNGVVVLEDPGEHTSGSRSKDHRHHHRHHHHDNDDKAESVSEFPPFDPDKGIIRVEHPGIPKESKKKRPKKGKNTAAEEFDSEGDEIVVYTDQED